ncbi:hypothetical protein D6825_00005, partial [Candidatus Woesearchaeota archaeon]
NFCEDYTDVFLDMFKDRATVYSDVLFREDRDIASVDNVIYAPDYFLLVVERMKEGQSRNSYKKSRLRKRRSVDTACKYLEEIAGEQVKGIVYKRRWLPRFRRSRKKYNSIWDWLEQSRKVKSLNESKSDFEKALCSRFGVEDFICKKVPSGNRRIDYALLQLKPKIHVYLIQRRPQRSVDLEGRDADRAMLKSTSRWVRKNFCVSSTPVIYYGTQQRYEVLS